MDVNMDWRPKGLEDWSPKLTLTKRGKYFCVEAVRWGKDLEHSNVYVYIYAGHQLFMRCEQSTWGCPFEMHGISLYKLHRGDNGAITSHQYGNDYDHLWHEERNMDGNDKWQSAMHEAREIFEKLSALEAIQ